MTLSRLESRSFTHRVMYSTHVQYHADAEMVNACVSLSLLSFDVVYFCKTSMSG